MDDAGGDRALRLLPFPVLLDRFRQGDVAAENELYRRYRDFIKRLAAPRMGVGVKRQADPSDIAQSVLRLFTECARKKQFASHRAIFAWMREVTRHKIARLPRRSRGPRRKLFVSIDDAAEELVDRGAPSPDAVAAHLEMVDLLKRAIDSLPEERRRIIQCRDIEQLEYGETAETLGLENADRARYLHRLARAALEHAMVSLLEAKLGGEGGVV